MTLEDLLSPIPDIEALKKLSDKDLEALLSPRFNVTRPELVREAKKNNTTSGKVAALLSAVEIEKKQKIEKGKQLMLEKFGVKI